MRRAAAKHGFLSSVALDLDRAMHEAFIRLFDPNGRVPSRGVQEIREGRRHPWRAMARRFVELRQARVPLEHTKALIAEMDRFVDGLYGVGFAC